MSVFSKGSAKTAATGKEVTVAEIDKTMELIDYKNETFNDVVYEIFAAREKIKGKIVERSPEDTQSRKSGKRKSLKRQASVAGAGNTSALFQVPQATKMMTSKDNLLEM